MLSPFIDILKTYFSTYRKTDSAKYSKRGLGLCGYSTPGFDDMAIDLAFIDGYFEKAGLGKIEHHTTQDFRGHYMIESTNNYFTPKKLVPYKTYMQYRLDEDPFGTLHRRAEASEKHQPMVRVKENEVLYFQKTTGPDMEGNL